MNPISGTKTHKLTIQVNGVTITWEGSTQESIALPSDLAEDLTKAAITVAQGIDLYRSRPITSYDNEEQ